MEVPLNQIFQNIIINPVTPQLFVGVFVLFILLLSSAFVSGSEVAFFSLSPQDKDQLKASKTQSSKKVLKLLQQAEILLATILIVNNLVNVGIVILSSFLTNEFFDFSQNPQLGLLFQLIIITFILLLFGEIIPKVYASRYPVAFSRITAPAIQVAFYIFHPFSSLLEKSSGMISKRLSKKKQQVSIDELTDALDLTEEDVQMDDKILKGIVNFSSIGVSEIMCSRMDIVTVNIQDSFNQIMETVRTSGFSRIPVIDKTFDNTKGILYVKDLLPHVNKSKSFRWQSLIRNPFFIPESKKIDVLLKDFQSQKIHLAIVVDEYGGSSGIVTMEDVLEEIVGEINDEFDSIEQLYKEISKNKYQFEAKTLLIDFCKKFKLEDDYFDEDRGDADTIAGFILELKSEIPDKNEIIEYKQFTFEIKSVDNRRIKQIFVTLKTNE